MTKEQEKWYNAGINACVLIMRDLYDIHGDYSEVQEVYFEFQERIHELKKVQATR